MATYKKKAGKKAKTSQANIEQGSTTAEVFNTLDETASKSESFVEKNQNIILYGIVAVAVIILGTIGYNKYIQEPKEAQAADELAYPKVYFTEASTSNEAVDSLLVLGLEGANGKYGFIDIASVYSGTKAGNLANYYAGVSYLKLKNYESAIDYLSAFKSNDLLLEAESRSLIGDAFADINQLDDALNYYEIAAQTKPNEAMTPLYLMKAGQTAMALEDFSKAEALFTEIKVTYPKSDLASNIDMYINKAKYSK
ncbi:MAG: tetratricopeptide repeat protein [Flavobacteriaceae bacterium]